MGRGFGRSKKANTQKLPRPVTERSLQWHSKRHLERYIASAEQLRRVLMRRVNRRLRAFPDEDRSVLTALVDTEVQRCMEQGFLNDERVADLWVEQLRNRGDSQLSIQQKLRQKGIASEVVQQALSKRDESTAGDAALLCAIAYARRRGLGPFRRDASLREPKKKKDMAAMMRAGHSYDHIRQILNTEDINQLIEYAEMGE